ncbi:MAG: transposase [Acidobacteriota bacterium]
MRSRRWTRNTCCRQLRRNPVAAPRTIGIDEVSQRKGHAYRIVVSDLERGKPIWFGGEDRSEASMDMFYEWLGPKKTKKIELAVMNKHHSAARLLNDM